MKRIYTLFVISLFVVSPSLQAQQKIKTIAGTGVSGFSGDGNAAAGAELFKPLGVAVDYAGNVYIADNGNNRVRKINISGIITTIAGNGLPGYSGNGSVGTSAKVNPHSVAVDKSGNIYMSDPSYGVIRKVDHETNIITTVAGNGVWGFTGDGGPATNARLRVPLGIALDQFDNLYIADAGNHAVRKVTPDGMISTVAGMDSIGFSGDGGFADTARLDSPVSVAVDHAGNIFISDYGNNVIRKVNNEGFISTVVGTYPPVYGYAGDGGLAVLAQLFYPEGLAVDTFGNLFIADANNNVIRKVDTFGIIRTVAGNGTPGFGGDLGFVEGANLHNPYAVTVDVNGSIYVADANNQRVRKTYAYTAVNSINGSNTTIAANPNPFTNQINVSGLDKTDKICVYDMVGRAVSEVVEVTNAGAQTFDINGLSPGIYMLRAFDSQGNKKAVIKLIKE